MRWLLCLVCLTRTALADDTAAVAIVDFDRVLAESAPGKHANVELQDTRKKKQATLDAKQADIRTLQKTDPAKASEALAKLGEEYRRLEAEMKEIRTKLTEGVLATANPAFVELAAGKTIVVVSADGFIYKQSTPGDVTSDLIARLAPGGAQLRPATMRYRVGIVDVEKLFATSPAGKRATRSFETLRTTKQAQLDADQTRLKAELAAVDKEPPGVQKQKRDALEHRFTELQEKYLRLEKELADARTRLIDDVVQRANHLAEDLARKQNLQFVVDTAAITYRSGELRDLTAAVALGLD